mgnify:CR=1 FL=1
MLEYAPVSEGDAAEAGIAGLMNNCGNRRAPCPIRTDDLPLTRRLLWPLSYTGEGLRSYPGDTSPDAPDVAPDVTSHPTRHTRHGTAPGGGQRVSTERRPAFNRSDEDHLTTAERSSS